jgi:hypothetical protein
VYTFPLEADAVLKAFTYTIDGKKTIVGQARAYMKGILYDTVGSFLYDQYCVHETSQTIILYERGLGGYVVDVFR